MDASESRGQQVSAGRRTAEAKTEPNGLGRCSPREDSQSTTGRGGLVRGAGGVFELFEVAVRVHRCAERYGIERWLGIVWGTYRVSDRVAVDGVGGMKVSPRDGFSSAAERLDCWDCNSERLSEGRTCGTERAYCGEIVVAPIFARPCGCR